MYYLSCYLYHADSGVFLARVSGPEGVMMHKQTRILFTIIGLITLLGGLLPAQSAVMGQSEPPYLIYFPVINKSDTQPPAYYSTTWYFTTDMLKVTNGKRNIYYKGVQAGNLTAPPGRQDQLVLLHFGRPRTDTNQVGTRIYFDTSGGLTSTNDIIIYTKEFINGFMVGALANNDTVSKLELGVGTSNLNYDYYESKVCKGYFCTTTEAYNHGKAWALMIDNLNQWVIAQGYASRVSVSGANDIELAWNTANITHAWVRGFDDYDQGKYIFYNFGACEGCDTVINLSKPPDPYKKLTGDWTPAKVYYSAWEAPPAWPIPEIYTQSGTLANQWANISKVGVMLGKGPMYFFSPLSQYQACQSANDPLCAVMGNTPQQAWLQLYTALNKRPETAQNYIPYMTDIKWP